MSEQVTFWLTAGAGLVLGVAICLGVNRIRASQRFSKGGSQLLSLLNTPTIVIDRHNLIVGATESAARFGFTEKRLLIDETLLDLAEIARSSDDPVAREIELSSTLEPAIVSARVTKMGKRWVLFVLEDLTESRRLDDTRRDFVANISHELKTPIGAIGLLAEALMDAKDDPSTVSKFSESLFRESRRLGHLVQEIIELSRLQSADALTKAKVVDFAAVIADAVDANALTAEKHQIKVVTDAPGGIEVFANADMLATAVRNLIENAILYSSAGSQVGVGLRVTDELAEVAITDSGVGISPEDQERIFERFYRVDDSRSRDTGGTGLGLAIVKHVVNIHRGELSVFSRPGLGSTFTIRIPLASSIAIETEETE